MTTTSDKTRKGISGILQAPRSKEDFESTILTADAIRSIPFPKGKLTRLTIYPSQLNGGYVIGVHRLSNSIQEDGRFIIRGFEKTHNPHLCENSLQQVKTIAGEMGIRQLVTQEKIPLINGKDASALSDAGFEPIDESITLMVPFTLFAKRATRIAKALSKRNKIPSKYKILPIRKVADSAMRILHRSKMMDDYDFRNKFVGDSVKSFSHEHCLCIIFENKMVGIILVAKHNETKTYEILIRWVDESYRGTWVNAVLINEAVRQGLEIDIDFLCFNANSERHRETLHLAKNAGAVIVAKSRRYSINLEH